MKTTDSDTGRLERLVVRRQPGQIIVVFAGALVLLLLIGALVIDLGFVFMTKRQEQNAADPGAVAAARYIQPSADVNEMWNAACFYAVQNGFHATKTGNGGGLCAGAGTGDGSTITVNYPPSASAGEFAFNTSYVEVVISRNHSSFLAGIIGLGQIPVTAGAVAANDTGTGASASLVALNPTKCGAGGDYIHPAAASVPPGSGGFIQVNSDCGAGGGLGTNDTCTDGAPQGGFVADGGTTVTGPGLYVYGACDMNGASTDWHVDTVDEAANRFADLLSLLRPPAPTDLTIRQCGTGQPSTAANPKHCTLNGTVTLDPGTYYGGWRIATGGANVTLNPGIYVIAGGGIDDTGGILTSASGRVLIYSTDASATWKTKCIAGQGTADACQGVLKMAGGTNLHLEGLDRASACPPYSTSGCPYGGLLMWQDANGSATARGGSPFCDVSLGGSSSLYLTGTIYAKCGNVTILGNNATGGCDLSAPTQDCAAVQIIADTFDVGGGAILDMPYDPKDFYRLTLKGLVR